MIGPSFVVRTDRKSIYWKPLNIIEAIENNEVHIPKAKYLNEEKN